MGISGLGRPGGRIAWEDKAGGCTGAGAPGYGACGAEVAGVEAVEEVLVERGGCGHGEWAGVGSRGRRS